MVTRDRKFTTWFERFDIHRYTYTFLIIFIYLFLNNTINALSVWTEHNRQSPATISPWEPWVWEYTSAFSSFLLIPLIYLLVRRFPLRFTNLKQQIGLHLLATILFSIAHVGLMVAFREGIYLLANRQYTFSPWLSEFWYEYRKDAWGYLSWVVIFHLYEALYARIKGEASLLNQRDDESYHGSAEASNQAPQSKQNASSLNKEFLLVKKLDKEFLIKIAEIEWLEASGNYVNLHKSGRIYPFRGTLSSIMETLGKQGFCRIHRSYAVNLSAVDNIQYQSSGDGRLTLTSGEQLNVSRRFKQNLASI